VTGRMAYLMPGQGAQAVGMGRGFYDAFDEARALYGEANAALGFDLTALCFEGPEEELVRTDRCQLALFVTSLAAFAALRTRAPAAAAGVAGLSLGELTALAAAEAMSIREGLYLVQARGEAMAECAARHPGRMLAVLGLARDVIERVARESGAVAANFNAPEQVVLSGTDEAITKAEGLANAAGAKRAVKLDVSGAFHSPLMQPASAALRQAVGRVRFSAPKIPVVSNVTGAVVRAGEDIPELLVAQIVSPVRWDDSIRTLIGMGADTFVEFPPAGVLSGLLRRIDRGVKGLGLNEPADLDHLAAASSTPQ